MVESRTKAVVVAGVADLDGTDPALRALAGIARASGVELHLVHAYEMPRLFSMSPGLGIAFPEGADSYHDAVLAMLRDAALRAGAGTAVCHVIEGSPGPSVLRVARDLEAALVVVGATRASRLHRLLLGTTAQRVLRESEVPVLVVRGGMPLPPWRVLFASDLTVFSAQVRRSALDTIGRVFGPAGRLRALYVLPWGLLPQPGEMAPVMHSARARLDAFLERCAGPAHDMEPAVRVGEPAEQIVAEARDWGADLVVVGTHARGWGARLLLGSVAEAALRDAPCNVLAVPPVAAGAAGTREPAAREERVLAGVL